MKIHCDSDIICNDSEAFRCSSEKFRFKFNLAMIQNTQKHSDMITRYSDIFSNDSEIVQLDSEILSDDSDIFSHDSEIFRHNSVRIQKFSA